MIMCWLQLNFASRQCGSNANSTDLGSHEGSDRSNNLLRYFPLIAARIFLTSMCSNRYLSLYEKISTQLRALTGHLHRLTIYEELFVSSVIMQEELKRSYINVLRFWSRVAKECKRSCKFERRRHMMHD
jgi:hypothetical protein